MQAREMQDFSDLKKLLYTLRNLIERKSIQKRAPGEPDFELTSGVRSRYYCDMKPVLLSPEGSRLIGEILFRFVVEEGAEAVGGLQLGATFIATAVALVSELHNQYIYGFTVRDQQKAHGTKEKVAASFHPDGQELLCPNRRVVIVDDVVTGGGSVLKAVAEVQGRQCEILAVIALVDRGAEGGSRIRAKNLRYLPLFRVVESGDVTINPDILSCEPAGTTGPP
jgi:orotate phosphoribosyltransferase